MVKGWGKHNSPGGPFSWRCREEGVSLEKARARSSVMPGGLGLWQELLGQTPPDLGSPPLSQKGLCLLLPQLTLSVGLVSKDTPWQTWAELPEALTLSPHSQPPMSPDKGVGAIQSSGGGSRGQGGTLSGKGSPSGVCQAPEGREERRLDTEEEAGGLLPVQPLLRIAGPPPTSQYSHSDTGWS